MGVGIGNSGENSALSSFLNVKVLTVSNEQYPCQSGYLLGQEFEKMKVRL